MPESKLRKLKGELFGLESYLEKKLSQLKGALASKPAVTAKPVEFKPLKGKAGAKAPKKVKPTKAAKASKTDPSLAALNDALANHPRRADLVRAGSQKDQLLRSLVPLYLGRIANVEVNSGLISRFWKKQGVSYFASNAAKALREHVGYARATKTGRLITPNGVKYIESALAKTAA